MDRKLAALSRTIVLLSAGAGLLGKCDDFLAEGDYRLKPGVGILHANSVGHYCVYDCWQHYIQLGGDRHYRRADPIIYSIPTSMHNDGACGANPPPPPPPTANPLSNISLSMYGKEGRKVCLEENDIGTGDGVLLQEDTCTGQPNQRFTLNPIEGPMVDGNGMCVTKLDDQRAMALVAQGIYSAYKMDKCTGATSQIFALYNNHLVLNHTECAYLWPSELPGTPTPKLAGLISLSCTYVDGQSGFDWTVE